MVFLSTALFAASAMASAPVGKYFDNYIFVIMENNDLINVLKNSDYASLLSSGVEFLDYHGTTHPSQPNYWSTIAQSTFRGLKEGSYLINGTNGDDNFNITGATHIGDSLEAAGLDWAIYSENYPGNSSYCFTKDFGVEANDTNKADPEFWETNKGQKNRLYKRKHNPFISFDNIYGDAARCGAHVKSYDDWEAAVASDVFPAYSYIVPNQVDDAHDFPGDSDAAGDQLPGNAIGIQYSVNWFNKFYSQIKASKYLNSRRTLIHLTFDENDLAYELYYSGSKNCTELSNNCPGDVTNNRVYGVLLGSAVSCYANSTITGTYDHNSIVSTLVDNWSLKPVTPNDCSPKWPLQSCPVASGGYVAPPATYAAPKPSNLYSGAASMVSSLLASAAVVALAL